MNFDPLTQIMASRGYVVFEMNFRGSRGFGREFYQAGFGEWGGLMQSDITDGIDAMIERGIADPDRMCMVGWSYGAYAAMLEAIRHPDRFQCVAAIAGVYDLITLLESPQGIMGAGLWHRSIGTVEDDREFIEQISPINLISDDLPPVYMVHGQRDFTAPPEQSIEMIEAMEERGVIVSSQIFPLSEHQFAFEPDRIEMFGRLANFLDDHLVEVPNE